MNRLLVCLFAMVIFSSCDQEEQPSISKGNVWVINEGNFGSSNATIGVYNTNDSSYSESVFFDTNGYFIGDVLQSVDVAGEIAYGVLNGSNTIESFETGSFESIETLEHRSIDKPRYMAIEPSKNRAFVSIWGPYNTDYSLSNSKVLVLDLNSMTVIDSIGTAPGVEQIELIDNALLVSRNYYGAFNHLSIISTTDLSLKADIELPAGPDEIFLDSQGAPWVVCTSGKLVKIDVESQRIDETIDLGAPIFGDVDIFDGQVYFLQGDVVKSVVLSTGEVTERVSSLSVTLPYTLGVNPFNGDIYLGDGVAYGSEGKVYHYKNGGELVQAFQVGIFPSQFLFN